MKIPYGRQSISSDDIDEVVKVLRSDFLTQGPAVARFESAFSEKTKAPHAVAVSNATAGLHLACMALDLKAGDELWTSPNTFVASANAALYCGARPDFVDIDPATLNMNLNLLEEKLIAADRSGRLPKVVVPVHFGGLPCDLPGLAFLAQKYGFKVIEDASHAVGARWKEERIGECLHSDLAVFSFHPVKIVTTGEGGVVATRRSELAEKVRRLRSHGIVREANAVGGWYYEQVELGYNYRLTDLQAALGTSQLNRLESFVEVRNALATRYDDVLKSLPVRPAPRRAEAYSAFHLYVIQIESADPAAVRRKVYDRMKAAGIEVNVHYMPVYLQPFYQQLGFRPGYCPAAEAYYQSALTLPLYPELNHGQQDFVKTTLEAALRSG